jgi:hypothetical protein
MFEREEPPFTKGDVDYCWPLSLEDANAITEGAEDGARGALSRAKKLNK